MDYLDLIRRLWHLKWAVLAVVLAGSAVAVSSYFDVSLTSLRVKSKAVVTHTASGQLLVDASESALGDNARSYGLLADRARLYTAVFQSDDVRDEIARVAQMPPAQLELLNLSPGSRDAARRNQQDGEVADPTIRQLTFAAQPGLPLIDVEAESANPREATRLVDAGLTGVIRFITALQQRQQVPAEDRVALRRLGAVERTTAVEGPSATDAVVNGGLVVAVGIILLLVIDIGLVRPPGPQAIRNDGRLAA